MEIRTRILKYLFLLRIEIGLFIFFFFILTIRGNSQIISNDRPNIIVFMVDDMGWEDTSVPFYDSVTYLNRLYRTPNMERLANEGVKFTNAYAQPVCTPSRVSYMTGINAARTKVTNWTSPLKDTDVDVPDKQFLPLKWNINGLTDDPKISSAFYATAFPQILRDSGYYTIHVGKAHFGSAGTPGANPYNFGFMVNIAGHAAGNQQSYLSEEQYGNLPYKNRPQAVPDLEQYYQTGTFLTEALTLEALKALETPISRGEPFFLNMAHYALHTPFEPDKRFIQKYYDIGIDSVEAMYAALIEGMDKSLGDIMDFLKKKNIEKNTILIFMSDNGGLDYHTRSGTKNIHNYPLRSGKGSVYEGGIREPMIVKWPKVTEPNTVNKNQVIIEDFFPSILEMAGVKMPKNIKGIDGISFVPTLKNHSTESKNRPLIFHYPHNWVPLPQNDLGINYHSAMRLGDWKIVYNMRDESFQLFNITRDIREEKDLSIAYPKKLNELKKIFGKTLRERNAQMPVLRKTGKAVRFPDEI